MSRTVYIAGPMRGKELYNFPQFFHWQVILEEAGFNVINPAAIDCKRALYSDWHFQEADYEDILAEDLAIIASGVDILLVLEGWEDSEGANREIGLAVEKGIKIMYAKDYEWIFGSKKNKVKKVNQEILCGHSKRKTAS